MNTQDKVNLYKRLLRKAKAELRRAALVKTATELPEEYFIPVTSAQLDPEVIHWFHSGQTHSGSSTRSACSPSASSSTSTAR